MRVFLETQTRLALDASIHGQTRQVKDYLMGISDWQNRVPGPIVVAREMRLGQSSVYRAYAELKRVEVLIVKDGDFYLSPKLCWKGRPKELERACKELLPLVKALPSGLVKGGSR